MQVRHPQAISRKTVVAVKVVAVARGVDLQVEMAKAAEEAAQAAVVVVKVAVLQEEMVKVVDEEAQVAVVLAAAVRVEALAVAEEEDHHDILFSSHCAIQHSALQSGWFCIDAHDLGHTTHVDHCYGGGRIHHFQC